MSLLEKIHVGKRPAPRRTLLYGVKGVGKSTWASMAPHAVFVPTEEGLNDIDCQSFPLCNTFQEYMKCLYDLYEHCDTHGYRTVITDSLDWLEQLIHRDVARLRGVSHISSIDFSKGYEYALNQWGEVLAGMDALRSRGMSIINLAHEKKEKCSNPLTASAAYDRYEPRLHKYAAAMLQEWSDEVLFATYKVYTTTTDEGFGKTKTHGVGNGERILLTTDKPSAAAKNRLNLPDELPLDYRVYADYLSKSAA